MTVSSLLNKVQYTANGVLTTFTYPFKIFDESHITVISTVDGTDTTETNYAVTGVGNEAGGTVVFNTAPTNNTTITIKRVLPLTQETDYVENDPFPAEAHENALDEGIMIDQQLNEDASRSLKYPVSDPASITAELPSYTERAEKLLGFDETGAPSLSDSTIAEVDAVVAEARGEGTLITSDSFTGDGTTTSYNITATPVDKYGLLITVGGIAQEPSTYSVSGTTVTFTEAPGNGVEFTIRNLGYQVGTTTVSASVVNYVQDGGTTRSVQERLRVRKYLSDYANLSTALTHIGSNYTSLVIDEAFTIGEDTTIPANIDIEWLAGCLAYGAYDLVVEGNIEAGNYTLVDSAITLKGLAKTNVKWFGAAGDGSTDDYDAVVAALDSLFPEDDEDAKGGILLFGIKEEYVLSDRIALTYNYNNTVIDLRDSTLVPEGTSAFVIPSVADGDLGVSGARNITIKNGKIDGDDASGSSATGIISYNAENLRVENMWFEAFAGGGATIIGTMVQATTAVYEDIILKGNNNYGIKVDTVEEEGTRIFLKDIWARNNNVGIDIAGGSATISNVYCFMNYVAGMRTAGNDQQFVKVVNADFSENGNSAYGFYTNGTFNCLDFSNVRAHDNGVDGILIQNSGYFLGSNISCEDNGNDGFKQTNGTSSVANLRCVDSSGYGLRVTGGNIQVSSLITKDNDNLGVSITTDGYVAINSILSIDDCQSTGTDAVNITPAGSSGDYKLDYISATNTGGGSNMTTALTTSSGTAEAYIGKITGNALTLLSDAGSDTTYLDIAGETQIANDKLGLYGATPIAKQTITGSKGGNAALGDLLTKLASLGLITDSTT